MSYYEVRLDGAVIHDTNYRELTLLEPVVELDIGAAGSFDFTVPVTHLYRDKIIPYGSNIEVRENGKQIFWGRPLPPSVDFQGQRSYHCEGMLAVLNDVVLPARKIKAMNFRDYMDYILNYVNTVQKRKDRKFRIIATGEVPKGLVKTEHEWKYQTALEEIRDGILQYTGDYISTWGSGDGVGISWGALNDLTENGTQPIRYTVNMLELLQTGQPFYTEVIATGGEDVEGREVKLSAPYRLDKEIAKRYGNICAHMEYPQCETLADLKNECKEFLESQQFAGMAIETKAADLHNLNPTYEEYRLGQVVNILCLPLGVNAELPITNLKIDLTSAIKTATLGITEETTLTAQARKQEQEIRDNADVIDAALDKTSDTADYRPGTVKPYNPDTPTYQYYTGTDGNDYAVSVDGEGVHTTKIPREIEFYKAKGSYIEGDTFNLADYAVRAIYGDGSQRDITEECTYNYSTGDALDEAGDFELMAEWQCTEPEAAEETREEERGDTQGGDS